LAVLAFRNINVGTHGEPVSWPQEILARAVDAGAMSRSIDCVLLAKAALEAAIHGAYNVEELLGIGNSRPSASTRQVHNPHSKNGAEPASSAALATSGPNLTL